MGDSGHGSNAIADAPSVSARAGRLVAAHPWRVVIAWAVTSGFALALAVVGVTGESLFSRLETGNPSVPGEAQTGGQLLTDPGMVGGAATVMLSLEPVTLGDPTTVAALTEATQVLADIPGVREVASPLTMPAGLGDPAAQALVAADPAGILTIVTLDPDASADEQRRARADVTAAFGAMADLAPGSRARVGTPDDLTPDITGQVEADLRLGEGIAIPITFLIMIVVFGGFVAAGLPVIGAIASIFGALGTLYAFSYVIDLDVTVVNVVTLLGLGLSIDYGLLVVSRFREEMRRLGVTQDGGGLTDDRVMAATQATMRRAGRTVVFSALTVAIALGGLLVFDAAIVRAVGAAGVAIVVVALLAALTLVPALCVLGARRLMKGARDLAPDEGVFSRLARVVQRWPVAVTLVTTAVLVAMSVPAWSMRLTSSGPELLPVSAPSRVFFEHLVDRYPLVAGAPVQVAADGSLEEVTDWLAADVASIPGVELAVPRQHTSEIVGVDIYVSGGAMGDDARSVVSAVRDLTPPFQTWVTGQAAGLADFTASMTERAPYAVALVVLGTLVLLFLLTGSVVIPVKALVLNVLSLGACLGVLVWVFQDGNLEGVLGFSSNGAIESVIPLLVLAFGFGLSMDYEVFLIARIAEERASGLPNDLAVSRGLQTSGRIITSAALLIMIVFAGFIAGQLIIIKQTGLALTTAVALDATLVRMLLVPATMTLLGERSWWAPGPLRRWHARFGLQH